MALGVSSFAAALLAALALTNAVFATGGAAAGVPDQYRVNLRVFFRAFCPACQWFVGDPLLELIRDEQLRNIVNLKLIPAAGMRDKDGDIECESGVIECTGHRWQACVIDTYHDDVVKYLGTIACIEGDESGRVGDWNTKIQNCLTDEERVVIKECYNTKSKNLLLEMIRKDHAGQVGWMPYVITEDKVLGTASEGVGYNNLLGNVCIAYKGPRESYPDACKQLVGPQKQFPAEEPIAAQQLAPADPMGEKLDPQVNAGEQNNAAPVADEELELDIKDDEPEAPEQVPEAAAADTGKVRMELYWRAFCPGCMSFITKPLLKLMRDQQFQAIVDFVPVPAAGTTFDSEGNFVCNKGLVECMGHRWLSCVVEEAPDLGAKIEALACMESGDNKGLTWSAIVGKCFSGGALTKMKTCYDTKSEDLLRKHVATRLKLKIPWVPYVILNGQPIGDASHGITLKYLTESVCSAFTGSQELLPSACQPKRLRQDEQEKEAEEDKAIKPCPPKKEGKDKAVVYEDAPGIGKRVIGDGNTVMELDAKVQGGNIQRHSSFSGQTMILSGLCFVLIAVLVLRFSGDHKKDA